MEDMLSEIEDNEIDIKGAFYPDGAGTSVVSPPETWKSSEFKSPDN